MVFFLNFACVMKHQDYVTDAIDLLCALINTPSVSREEKDAADLMEQRMKSYGLAPHREANNLWLMADGYDEQKPTLLLNAHIDTVKPAISWTRDPFRASVEDDRIYGLSIP